MPECNALYLAGYLFDVGPTQPAGMGETGVSEGEIESWQNNRSIRLTPWESGALKRASREYARQAQLATKSDCPPPWEDAPYIGALSNQKAESLRDSMRDLAKM